MKNKNDVPLTEIDLIGQSIESFEFIDSFEKIVVLKANVEKEKLEVEELIGEKYKTKKGLVYLFAIDGKVLKIGCTTTTMKDRIQSYNCGKKTYRENGTCSTTNYFILQSFLNVGKKVEVYGFYAPEIEVSVFGTLTKTSIQPKIYEKTILSSLKKNDKFPIMCTQT